MDKIKLKATATKAYKFSHHLPQKEAVKALEVLLEGAYVNGEQSMLAECREKQKQTFKPPVKNTKKT